MSTQVSQDKIANKAAAIETEPSGLAEDGISSENLSAYALGAPELIKLGFSTIRIRNGEKRPFGEGWQNYCRNPATASEVAQWSLGNFGLGIATGSISNGLQVIAIDLDLEDDELQQALSALITSNMEKFGQKGLTRFFLADPDLASRKYLRNKSDGGRGKETMVDLQANGRQVVVPWTIHPNTGRSYRWISGPVAAIDLPVLTADDLARFEDTLRHLGWDEQKAAEPIDPDALVHEDDEFQSIWAELNARALANLDSWVPSLGLHKWRHVGDRYEAVPTWRDSNTGRPVERRKRSLSIHPTGIRDWGTSEGFSPLALVHLVLGGIFDDAFRWLSEKTGLSAELDIIPIDILSAMEAKSTERRLAAEARLAARADFEILPPAPHACVTALQSRLVWDDREANEASRLPWLIKGLFPARGVSLLWGQSGAGKSYVALDLAASVMTGGDFFRHRTKATGGVLLALGEGLGSIPDRLNALRIGRFGGVAPSDPVIGGTLDLDRLPIASLPVSNLSVAAQWAVFAGDVRRTARDMEARHGRRLRLVIVDTVVASFGFEDDPDASKVTRAMKAMDELAQEMDVLFVPVHHAGKSKEAGEHGSYAWRGSAETSVEVDAEKDSAGRTKLRRLYLKKSRHGNNEGWNSTFELKSVELGKDEDGEPIESAYVAPWEPNANDNEPQISSPGAKRFMEALNTMIESAGVNILRDGADHPVRVTMMRDVLANYRDRRSGMNPDSVTKAFKRDLSSAQAGNLVETFEQKGEKYALAL